MKNSLLFENPPGGGPYQTKNSKSMSRACDCVCSERSRQAQNQSNKKLFLQIISIS